MKRFLSIVLCLVVFLLAIRLPAVSAETDSVTVDKQALLSALYEGDITSMLRAMDMGFITSEELTNYYLQRIEAYNKPYNCFITLCDDALDVARERDKQRAEGNVTGRLHGIPVVIKDNMDLSGYLTTNGRKIEDGKTAKTNAVVVDALLKEGAVIIAKTNMSTDAQDATCSYSDAAGETMNAYNKHLASGGSSGGTAVAVSLNFAAVGLGTDTNSSLRIPAALNGCVSLRPTFGLLSNDGVKRLNSKRDTPGAITRSVYDQAIMLDVLTEGQYAYTDNLNGQILNGLRIGVLKELSYATTEKGLRSDGNIDDEVAAAFENAVAQLQKMGAEVITVSMPDIFELSDDTFDKQDKKYKDKFHTAFASLLEENQIAAVVFPTYLSTPIRSGLDENGVDWDPYDQVNINNCRTLSPSASLPEISVPIGQHSLGAGIGMEIATVRNGEQLLLDIAYSYTNTYDHRPIPEGAPDAYAASANGDLNAVIDDYLYRLEESTRPPETTQEETTVVPTTVTTVPETTEQQIISKEETKVVYWPFVLIGAVTVVVVTLTIIHHVQVKRRKRRRRRNPLATNKIPD